MRIMRILIATHGVARGENYTELYTLKRFVKMVDKCSIFGYYKTIKELASELNLPKKDLKCHIKQKLKNKESIYDSDNTDITEDIRELVNTHSTEKRTWKKLWNNKKNLKGKLDGNFEISRGGSYEIVIFDGLFDINENSKWIICFDADTRKDAVLLDKTVDLDEYVKANIMKDVDNDLYDQDFIDLHTKEQFGIEIIYKIPQQNVKLDWTGQTMYLCLKNEYVSEFWGWTDRHTDYEPVFVNVSEGYDGYGLRVFDLTKHKF
jgi:hypothetical protein